MDVGSASDIGRVRERNEDALLVEPARGLFVVADGLGGHPAGDVASRLAIDTIRTSLDGVRDPEDDLRRALLAAHEAIIDDVRTNRDRMGMGTTAVIAHIEGRRTHLAHVGDSRGYLLRHGDLHQVTEDHSDGSRITQALGTSRDIVPDIRSLDLEQGDRLLLCTDGLTDMVTEDEIARITREAADAQRACDDLVEAALTYGGVDNITVIIVEP